MKECRLWNDLAREKDVINSDNSDTEAQRDDYSLKTEAGDT